MVSTVAFSKTFLFCILNSPLTLFLPLSLYVCISDPLTSENQCISLRVYLFFIWCIFIENKITKPQVLWWMVPSENKSHLEPSLWLLTVNLDGKLLIYFRFSYGQKSHCNLGGRLSSYCFKNTRVFSVSVTQGAILQEWNDNPVFADVYLCVKRSVPRCSWQLDLPLLHLLRNALYQTRTEYGRQRTTCP